MCHKHSSLPHQPNLWLHHCHICKNPETVTIARLGMCVTRLGVAVMLSFFIISCLFIQELKANFVVGLSVTQSKATVTLSG